MSTDFAAVRETESYAQLRHYAAGAELLMEVLGAVIGTEGASRNLPGSGLGRTAAKR